MLSETSVLRPSLRNHAVGCRALAKNSSDMRSKMVSLSPAANVEVAQVQGQLRLTLHPRDGTGMRHVGLGLREGHLHASALTCQPSPDTTTHIHPRAPWTSTTRRCCSPTLFWSRGWSDWSICWAAPPRRPTKSRCPSPTACAESSSRCSSWRARRRCWTT